MEVCEICASMAKHWEQFSIHHENIQAKQAAASITQFQVMENESYAKQQNSLGQSSPLDSQHNAIFPPHAHGGTPSANGLHGIFHLK
jgi:hypothetical protein